MIVNIDAKLAKHFIPEAMRAGIKDYLLNRIEMGSFLTAVFENDLVEAFRCADSTNIRELEHFASFLCNELPMSSYGPGVSPWGSRENVLAWLAGPEPGPPPEPPEGVDPWLQTR